eukprot:CAMPEP_0119196478 /NCGR_PEP_ID=MMETSP1316-20130426/10242_1 /TAXON_ID=41880 /ORGANISM="Pycnococcus provasolii, Strain RCC2336" /LENGTH=37 /DNA_ID= /DNA_START= /DNA_END= /DNA_ORIENTATION=
MTTLAQTALVRPIAVRRGTGGAAAAAAEATKANVTSR